MKTLEEFGIGRPSTYATIISTIQERGYVERADKRLHPTDLGLVVNGLVTDYFSEIVNVDFTAQLEENLDKIAWGEADWVEMLEKFREMGIESYFGFTEGPGNAGMLKKAVDSVREFGFSEKDFHLNIYHTAQYYGNSPSSGWEEKAEKDAEYLEKFKL